MVVRSSTFQCLSVLVSVGASSLLVGGCADPDSAIGFNESDPAARFRAVKQAARTDDQQAVKPLIQMLDSDDAAERLLAIRTLEKITGQTLGYDHAASKADRDEAVQRWTVWYAEGGSGESAAGSRKTMSSIDATADRPMPTARLTSEKGS